MGRREYVVRVSRSGIWWAIEVPDVAGVFSQAERIDQIEAMARDAIAGVLNVPPGSFDLRIEAVVPNDSVPNEEIDAAISEAARRVSFGEVLAQRGIITVALDEHGNIVQHGPDGSTSILD